MKQKQYELVITIVTPNYSDLVIKTAKELGVTSATFIKGRGTNAKETTKVLGMEIQPEKEVIMMVVPKDARRKIMTEIALVAGIKTEANGFCFTMPVESWTGTLPELTPPEKQEKIDSKEQDKQDSKEQKKEEVKETKTAKDETKEKVENKEKTETKDKIQKEKKAETKQAEKEITNSKEKSAKADKEKEKESKATESKKENTDSEPKKRLK